MGFLCPQKNYHLTGGQTLPDELWNLKCHVPGRKASGRQVSFQVPLKLHYLGTDLLCSPTKPLLSKGEIKVEESPQNPFTQGIILFKALIINSDRVKALRGHWFFCPRATRAVSACPPPKPLSVSEQKLSFQSPGSAFLGLRAFSRLRSLLCPLLYQAGSWHHQQAALHLRLTERDALHGPSRIPHWDWAPVIYSGDWLEQILFIDCILTSGSLSHIPTNAFWNHLSDNLSALILLFGASLYRTPTKTPGKGQVLCKHTWQKKDKVQFVKRDQSHKYVYKDSVLLPILDLQWPLGKFASLLG